MQDFLGEIFLEILPNIYVLKKWNWDYLKAETFQKCLVDIVRESPEKIFLLICNHPPCFTIGRGLQKVKSPNQIPLVDFEATQLKNLKYPLYEIKRGGGITFHYPGQVVCYPILNLNQLNLAVFDFMLKILQFTKESAEEQFDLNHLEIDANILGLWKKDPLFNYKIASIGLAVTRFITYHGMAINLIDDETFFNNLKHIHPCGLSSDFYQPIEYLIQKEISNKDLNIFADNLTKKIVNFISEIQLRYKNQEIINPI